MRRRLFLLLAVLIGTAIVPSAGAQAALAPAPPPRKALETPVPAPSPTEVELARIATAHGVTPQTLRAQWERVAQCEVAGNWSMDGPSYSGIGFLNSTWYEYGGGRFAPKASGASRDQQIIIGMEVTGGWVPDQDGCSTGGW